jgi:regulator of replication initiation timing
MTSGSTVLVVTRRADATSDDDVGEQVPCQRVTIQNGETEVYQAKSVNETWYRDAEHQLTAARAHMGNMRNGIAALERENAALRGEVEVLRSPYHHQQQQVSEEEAMRQYVARYHGQLHAGHVDQQQQRDDYAPRSMEHYLLARRYPVRRQGPGARVALGDEV